MDAFENSQINKIGGREVSRRYQMNESFQSSYPQRSIENVTGEINNHFATTVPEDKQYMYEHYVTQPP